MAREIVVNFNGEVSRFGLERVNRDKIYGRKRRVVVDREGQECSSAMLTVDGATVLGPGSTSLVYVDEDFNAISRRDLVPIDTVSGETLEYVASTLNEEQPLKGPIDEERFLDHVARAVYELTPEELGADLLAGLEDGGIYESRFNYAKSLDDSPMFLLKNSEGIFAVVGDEVTFDWCRPDIALPDVEDEDDDFDDDDDLDFGMF